MQGVYLEDYDDRLILTISGSSVASKLDLDTLDSYILDSQLRNNTGCQMLIKLSYLP